MENFSFTLSVITLVQRRLKSQDLWLKVSSTSQSVSASASASEHNFSCSGPIVLCKKNQGAKRKAKLYSPPPCRRRRLVICETNLLALFSIVDMTGQTRQRKITLAIDNPMHFRRLPRPPMLGLARAKIERERLYLLSTLLSWSHLQCSCPLSNVVRISITYVFRPPAR